MSSRSSSQEIAVIGVACYYPGASTLAMLWENILSRRVQFRRMLDQRLPLDAYYDEDPKAPEKTYGTKAAFIDGFHFDWMKHRIPRQTIDSTDIAHWLALDTALRAFEDAGYDLKGIPLQSTGVIVGNTLTGEQTRSQTLRLRWPYVEKAFRATLAHSGMDNKEIVRLAADMEKVYKSAFFPITEDSLAGGLANTIAGRICNFLNLKGGGYIVDGACSSSLLAVATAANALKLGDMDLVLAGGVDVSLDPFELVGFAKAGALARDKMRVYDQSASGFVPGEGCGFILLKRLADAVKDKNSIYAVINGWGISSDGKGGIMEPSVSGQALAIERAYKSLDYKASDVDFIEGHGTGTTKGDRVELEGIAQAVGQTVPGKDQGLRSCGITSFKSIVGHTKAAAGIGGLIKAVLAVNQRILPPTANCTEPNAVFSDKAKNLYPLLQGRILPPERIVRAGVSSAGFGGINCHVTLESRDEPRSAIKPSINERALLTSSQETEIFVFASSSTERLKKAIRRFKEELRNISVAEMPDLAAFLNKKVKSCHHIKAAVVTDSPENLYEALVVIEEAVDREILDEGQIRRLKIKDSATIILLSNAVKRSRVGFLYPGQGSQRLNMGRMLVERFSWARDILESSTLSLYNCIYKRSDEALTREDQQPFGQVLSDTRITQPAIILHSAIWTEFLSKLGIEPGFAGGHSLGELAAFYKGGAFDLESLVQFAEFRGGLMAQGSQPSGGGMAALLCSESAAEALINKIKGTLCVANINSPLQAVISGGNEDIEKVLALAEKEGIQARRLDVSNAFHSVFMNKASGKIRAASVLPREYTGNAVKVISCLDGAVCGKNMDLREYFSRQVVSPVNFMNLVRSISTECDVLIEVGPGRVLTDLVAVINKDQGPPCFPVESSAGKDADIHRLLAEIFIRNIPVRWEELYVNRLIRPFVPASRKKFIVNQCERPLKIGDQVLKISAADYSGQELQAREAIVAAVAPLERHDQAQIAQLLIDMTQKLTGFDQQSFSLDSRLLDDLNLDSIKAAELIGQVARKLGVSGQIDPSQFSNNSLGQIRDRLQGLAVQMPGQEKEVSSAGAVLKRYRDRRWVRNFVTRLDVAPIISRNINQVNALDNVLLLLPQEEKGLSGALAHELKASNVRSVCFSETMRLKDQQGKIDCLVAILPRDKDSSFSKEHLKVMMERLHGVVAIANSDSLHEGSFVLVAQFAGGYFAEQGGPVNMASCSAKALISTLALERPDLRIRVVDFDSMITDSQLAACITDELSTYERFNAAGYDARMVRRVVYYVNSAPFSYPDRAIRWTSKDVVIVTGGAKGITAACAFEFARSTRATMILLGRSPFPEDKKDMSDEIVQVLDRYHQQKLKCHYYACDVTDEKAARKVIESAEARFGKITGVIHGAGLNSLKRLKQWRLEDAFLESLPKVMGAVNICNALSNNPLKMIVGITSIIGVTGMEGSGWYGFANEALDLWLRQFKEKHPQTAVVTIAYSVWDEIGMGAKLGSVEKLSGQGIGAISVDEGVRRFMQIVGNDAGVGQVIVAARLAGIETWKPFPSDSGPFRFIEDIKYFMPGVELVAQAKLTVQDDPYLPDHNWHGSLLLPFVFGFEAMAQAAAKVLGVERLEQFTAMDIDLTKPIPVSLDEGTVIEIHALVLEKEEKDDRSRIKIDIYAQQTAFQQPHFSAVFDIGLNTDHVRKARQYKGKAEIDLGFDMQKDIYGPVLFQGKLFQRIERIHALSYDEGLGKGECIFTSLYNSAASVFLKENRKFSPAFLTGDPFFLDSILQSMQVIVVQQESLPNHIDRIEIRLPVTRNEENICARSVVHKVSEFELEGSSKIRTRQGGILSVEGCRLRVLGFSPEKPSANDLANPTGRDLKIIHERLVKASQKFSFKPPAIQWKYLSGLCQANRKERHTMELPLMIAAVKELVNAWKAKIKINSRNIHWLSSGRPVISGRGLKEAGISLSHKNDFVLCVAGPGRQGCDLEPIVHRGHDEWLSLIPGEQKNVFGELSRVLEDEDLAGTAIWSAVEAVRKAVQGVGMLKVEYAAEDMIILKDLQVEEGGVVILPLILTRLGKSVIVFYQNDLVAGKKASEVSISEKQLMFRKFGFDENIFAVNVDYSGPQKQYVFTKHFPVTFKTNKLLSRRVSFSSYFDWMGELREDSIYPIKHQLTGLFEFGEWGMASNSEMVTILGDVKANEIVQGRIWVEKVSGQKDSIFDLCFDWRKRAHDREDYERVAISRQRVSWIRIIGHGEAVIDELPGSIKAFMDSVKPRATEVYPIEMLPEAFGKLDAGKEVRWYPKRMFLGENVFETTLEHSNLVGNIYFSNYPKWLGMVVDKCFYSVIPDAYRGAAVDGEFICLKSAVSHLSEAMPFDRIKVKMYVERSYENGTDLYFDFFRILEDASEKKLAYAEHRLVWGKYDKDIFVPCPLPEKVAKFLNLSRIL